MLNKDHHSAHEYKEMEASSQTVVSMYNEGYTEWDEPPPARYRSDELP